LGCDRKEGTLDKLERKRDILIFYSDTHENTPCFLPQIVVNS